MTTDDMTTDDMTTGDMTTGDMTTGDMYRHPQVPINQVISTGQGLAEAAHSPYIRQDAKGTRRTGNPAVLARALRSSGCPLGPSTLLDSCHVLDISSCKAWLGPGVGVEAYACQVGTVPDRVGGLSWAEEQVGVAGLDYHAVILVGSADHRTCCSVWAS
ncbi:hypothetical protein [Streptomyces rochei]|uniref:hypothetical protein n=1 Tax=Streptomyces rochei TaxID=1928 RepID=UPI0036ADF8A0